jgi:PAS domain S-box-containing protein
MSDNKDHPVSPETQKWLDAIYDGIRILDKSKNLLFWNKGAENITGFSADEIAQNLPEKSFPQITDHKGKPLYPDNQHLESVLSSGIANEIKVYYTHRLGYCFPVSLYIHPMTDETGNITGLFEVFRDISIEEKVQKIENRYKKVVRQFVSETTYKEVVRAVNSRDYGIKAYNRNLTILFMDIVGFTALSEKLPPEKVVDMLNVYFTKTSRVIQKNRGDIDKFLGDGVMAIFEEPSDAVKASLDMLPEGLKTLNRGLQFRKLPTINLRIGINTGNLIQGNIGSEDRKDWTVVGDVVNTAYRIEEATEPGQILISEDTIGRLQRPEDYRFIKELSLKGKSTRIRVFSPR